MSPRDFSGTVDEHYIMGKMLVAESTDWVNQHIL